MYMSKSIEESSLPVSIFTYKAFEIHTHHQAQRRAD